MSYERVALSVQARRSGVVLIPIPQLPLYIILLLLLCSLSIQTESSGSRHSGWKSYSLPIPFRLLSFSLLPRSGDPARHSWTPSSFTLQQQRGNFITRLIGGEAERSWTHRLHLTPYTVYLFFLSSHHSPLTLTAD